MRGSPWAGTGRNVGFLADRQGFRALFDKTTPLARQLRVRGGKNWESQGMDHEVSWIAGEEQTLARMVTGIMWPRMANRAFSQRMAGESLISIAIVFRYHRGRRTFPGRSHAEKLTAMLQLLLPMGIGEEAVIADAVESARENVQEEAADELVGRESHGFLLIVVAIVSPGEFYLTIFDIDDPMIGDGHPVAVATNVVHHLLWSGEGRLGVHDPIDVSHQI
jgi:hypothetical protein